MLSSVLLAAARDKDLNVRNALVRFPVHVQSLIKCNGFGAGLVMRKHARNTRGGGLVKVAIILNKTLLGRQSS